MKKGRFITLEGGEGGGKSTQSQLLETYLKDQGVDVVRTREPGGSPGAEEIRSLLVKGDVARWDGMSEALLNFAARRDHLSKTIWPALEKGTWVISDRYADSTLAYQGYGHGLDLKKLYDLWDLSIDGFRPDLTFILDLDPKAGVERALGRGEGETRYERMETAFHQRLRDGFLEIAAQEPDRCYVIDATRSIEAIREKIIKKIAPLLENVA